MSTVLVAGGSSGIVSNSIEPELSRMNMMFGGGYDVPVCNGLSGIVTAEPGSATRVAANATMGATMRACFERVLAEGMALKLRSGHCVSGLQDHRCAAGGLAPCGDAVTPFQLRADGVGGDVFGRRARAARGHVVGEEFD